MKIQLAIVETSKSYDPSSAWSVIGTINKTFPDMAAAENWLKTTYGQIRRRKIFEDIDGTSVPVGWIFGYHNSDMSHIPVEKWLQQDWVTVWELHRYTISA